MGVIAVAGLSTKDPRVSAFVTEIYSDSGLTTLVDTGTSPSVYDSSTKLTKQVGIMRFRNLTYGATYYLRGGTIIQGVGASDWSSTYSLTAGADTSAGSISFGSGAPSGTAGEAAIYFDTAASYAMYVYHTGAWHSVSGSGGGGTSGGVFSSGSNANGYWVQDPTGHIHQWGVVATDINGGTVAVTFPLAFSSGTGVSPVVTTKSATDRITFVVDGSVTASGFTVGNNGSGGYAYWEADGPGTPATGSSIVIGFMMASGATGATLTPPGRLVAPRAAVISKCKVIINAADATTDLTFNIKKNGTSVFSGAQTVTHGTAAGTLQTLSLATPTISVAADDIFTIDITSGTAVWSFTAQLE
jgi:hypothetical protein